jgi:hypothetical protein
LAYSQNTNVARLSVPNPARAATDEMSPAFFEDVLEALGCPRWYRNPMVAEAIDNAWNAGHRTVGTVTQEVLKTNPRVRRLVTT